MAIKPFETPVPSLEEFERVSFYIQNRFHFKGRRAVNRGAPTPDHRRYLYRCTDKCSGTDIITYSNGLVRVFTRSEHTGDPKCPVLHQLELERANWTRLSGYRIETDICTEFPNYFRTKLKTKEDCAIWASDYRRATGFVIRMNDCRERKFGMYVIGKCSKDCGVTLLATLNPFCDFTFMKVNGEHNHGGQNFNCPLDLAEELTVMLETNPNPPRVFENFVFNRRFQCDCIEDLLNRDYIPTDVVVKHLGRKLKDKYKASGEYMRVQIPAKATQTEAHPQNPAAGEGRGIFVYVKGENERPIVVDMCNRISDMLNTMPPKELYKLNKALSSEDDNAYFKSKIASWNGNKTTSFTGFPVEIENPENMEKLSSTPSIAGIKREANWNDYSVSLKRPARPWNSVVKVNPLQTGVRLLVPKRNPVVLKVTSQSTSSFPEVAQEEVVQSSTSPNTRRQAALRNTDK
ncbi:hypothetical protein Ciccas_001582 [Cichlidogyrus casuarinus]|uniref:Uncharacterized protein n=1 Tax=Cichlidogyrus casuarinus TaxID=1844966 RepID=A0ABD2QJX7_9PLAT